MSRCAGSTCGGRVRGRFSLHLKLQETPCARDGLLSRLTEPRRTCKAGDYTAVVEVGITTLVRRDNRGTLILEIEE